MNLLTKHNQYEIRVYYTQSYPSGTTTWNIDVIDRKQNKTIKTFYGYKTEQVANSDAQILLNIYQGKELD